MPGWTGWSGVVKIWLIAFLVVFGVCFVLGISSFFSKWIPSRNGWNVFTWTLPMAFGGSVIGLGVALWGSWLIRRQR